MTYADFYNKYNGHYWDFDGYPAYNPYQCADLITGYSRDLGLPRFTGNAADFANQYPAGWVHVSVPQQGDVVVFARNAANGYSGHVAVYDSPGYYLSQNYPTGSNTHRQFINEPIISIIRPTTLQGNMPYSDAQYNQVVNEREELRNYSKQSNYKVAQLAHLVYDGLTIDQQPDSINRPWIDTYPVDKIVEGISRGRAPVGNINKDQVMQYIKDNLK